MCIVQYFTKIIKIKKQTLKIKNKNFNTVIHYFTHTKNSVCMRINIWKLNSSDEMNKIFNLIYSNAFKTSKKNIYI